MTITEFALLPMKAGSDIHDKNNQAAKTLDAFGPIVTRQDGYEDMWLGSVVENPSELQLLINWDTIESHHKFMNSADYGPAITNLGALIDGQPTIIHADFVDNGARRIAFSAPVTELVRVYMKSQSSSMEGNAQKLFEVLNEHAPGFVGGVSGWVVEDVEHEKLGPGVKGKVFAAAVGWQSVDAHMNFRETEQFKSNIHLLTDEATAVDMHHVKLMQPEGVEPPRPDDDPRIGGLGDKDIGQQTTM